VLGVLREHQRFQGEVERAGRPKDLAFLRMFEANLAGDE
jgi:hypothetical protein